MLSFVMGRKPFVKDKILQAAFDLFAREGYEAVSTRQIALAAGVGNASMFKHFPSKEELGHAVYQRAMKVFDTALIDVETAEQHPRQAVQAIVHMLYLAYDEHPRALALLVFPPHEFVPEALDDTRDDAIRQRVGRLLGIQGDVLAIAWGAMLGPLQDRFLRRRTGRMEPIAGDHAKLIIQLLTGVIS